MRAPERIGRKERGAARGPRPLRAVRADPLIESWSVGRHRIRDRERTTPPRRRRRHRPAPSPRRAARRSPASGDRLSACAARWTAACTADPPTTRLPCGPARPASTIGRSPRGRHAPVAETDIVSAAPQARHTAWTAEPAGPVIHADMVRFGRHRAPSRADPGRGKPRMRGYVAIASLEAAETIPTVRVMFDYRIPVLPATSLAIF